jgi:hypothetical protein
VRACASSSVAICRIPLLSFGGGIVPCLPVYRNDVTMRERTGASTTRRVGSRRITRTG